MAGRTYPNEIKRLFTLPGGDVGKACRKVALDIADEAKRIAQVELGIHPGDKPRSGDYARGFQVKVARANGKFAFIVSNKKNYAAALEYGTRPHIIRARRVQHLEFRGRNGVWYKVKTVSHPGNKAYRILERAATNTMKKL
jgi:hypothetical protein